ncbi:MAG: response regulator [Chloroflexi bacterium]|nr:response regulator [Chloroflexota bacterium]
MINEEKREQVILSTAEGRSHPSLWSPARVGRILIIEDDPLIAQILKEMVKQKGYESCISLGSQQGLDEFDSDNYNIVFMDLSMPCISGWELCKSIKAKNPAVIAVLITGWDITLFREQIEESAVDCVLSKPFQQREVTAILERASAHS